MTETAGRLAANGAMLLDRKMPGWYTAIHRESLDIADPERCVLGQLFGDYNEGIGRLFPNTSLLGFPPAYNHGFDAPTLKDCADLGEAWLVEVRKRTQEDDEVIVYDRELVMV